MKWSKLPQHGDIPVSRSSHTTNNIGGKLYTFGGEHEPRTPIDNHVYVYTFDAGEWGKLAVSGDIPASRVGHTAAVVGTSLYVFGGRQGKGFDEAVQNLIYKLDTTSGVWTCLQNTTGTPPPARSYHTMTAAGTKLYIFGGCSSAPGGGRLADLFEFNTETLTWRQLPSAPSDHVPGRGGSSLSATATSLLVIGGFCGRELTDMHEFDLASETWGCPGCVKSEGCGSRPSGLPGRSVFGAVVHGCGGCTKEEVVVVFGGEVDPSDKGHDGAGAFTGDMWCFERGVGWRKGEATGENPGPRGWFAVTSFGGKMVVHGGLDGDNQRLDDLYLLDIHADE